MSDHWPSQSRQGAVAFLLAIFGTTWAIAAAFDDSFCAPVEPIETRLLRAAVFYASLMTFQPLIALWVVRRWFDGAPLDLGLRAASSRFQLLAILGPLALAGLAMGIAAVIQDADARAAVVIPSRVDPAPIGVIRLFGFMGMVCLLWVQAVTEEIGWRGYLLPRLMRLLGPFAGLFAHGFLWGLWYAPVLLLCGGTGMPPFARCAAFVVTCSLLGVLLGWVRIVSRSILASATANALLTLAAALPLFLQGEALTRAAIYLPAGWAPLALCIVILFLGGGRSAIRDFARDEQSSSSAIG